MGQRVILLVYRIILIVRLIESLIEGLVEYVLSGVPELEERVTRVVLFLLGIRADSVLCNIVNFISCVLVGALARIAIFAHHSRLLQFFNIERLCLREGGVLRVAEGQTLPLILVVLCALRQKVVLIAVVLDFRQIHVNFQWVL